ncbi:bifunctional UDP-N-acetylglucosamine diphosphorylase/glucosamine-1-phosphate N-acetyltransferase GlmU, partial [Alicyclobacillus sp.]|uniref:bifunctional UDP-N-acetylglucosamine diphosphorylase/glucosamine-1-phosphate N-acetyltransferase GlmU n=1 Tax=Alicyclobacillus sp. TaxID=61169 RepID=UPI0025BD3D0E
MGRAAIVLAAGHGTRMKSKLHKVLHPVCGKPMIAHILDELASLRLDQILVVVGQHREAVSAAVGDRAETVVQEEQRGTGHAVQVALPRLAPGVDTVVVLYGDAPLIKAETVERLLSEREARGAAACVLTARVPDPTGLGRVEVAPDGQVVRIVEEKDATPKERENSLINTGIYAFSRAWLGPALEKVRPDNAQGEYYLTDTVGILRQAGQPVYAVEAPDADEVASVNDRWQLAQVERILRQRINRRWALAGVTLIDPDTTYIGAEVTIGQDTVIYPGCVLEGDTRIGEGCVIGPHTRLVNATVQPGATVEQSVVLSSEVGPRAAVGPFAYIRPGSRVGADVKIGDFVEVKNSVIGDGTKVSHLAYVGDADIGRGVNVGCGVITVNYDGEKKHRTVVGDGAFVGSNVNLIAPVTVGDGAYLCAGSTITDDVPEDAFAIARARQVTKPGYVRTWKARRGSRVNGEG